MKLNLFNRTDIGLAWCLFCNDVIDNINLIQKVRQQLQALDEAPVELLPYLEKVKILHQLPFPKTLDELKKYQQDYSQFWSSSVGLVYGGATKIKQYVFEAAKLPDIRGASSLLDRINLIDLPAFFACENHPDYEQCQNAKDYCQKVREGWLNKAEKFPELSKFLIPELIIYSTGGNILAFCPAAFIDDLANAIEKRYTEETLTANSCAVGSRFKLIEIKLGLLPDEVNEQTFWLEKCCDNWNKNPLIQAYFKQPNTSIETGFQERKTFNELVGKLASLFNQRRNGNSLQHNRALRCYPPMFETHPLFKRDEGDRRSAVMQAKTSPNDPSQGLPGDPWFSEASARKRLVGQVAKRDNSSKTWYEQSGFDWQPGEGAIETWVNRFEKFLHNTPHRYYGKIRSENIRPHQVKEAISVREIADASKPSGFLAFIYADGNNMGGYIQKEIQNPEDYKRFSEDVFDATEKSVYIALTEHLKPHKLNPNLQAERKSKKEVWIHPFEILTIGGDDVMLIVPADKALAIAKTIGDEFERILLSKSNSYKLAKAYKPELVHRYQEEGKKIDLEQCKLSMSTGVLITAENTPIYYAQKLTEQLLKSAKKQAKELKKHDYYSGTVDFLVMKSVTMISSNIGEFRSNGLTKLATGQQKLKLYAAPYTLHELGGLLETAKALKDIDFPKSQLYQIRSLLERGKQTAIINYRYFKVRLSDKKAQNLLTTQFENSWCKPKNPANNGSLAPWMSLKEDKEDAGEKVTYETIWRELVDLYPFTEKSEDKLNSTKTKQSTLSS